MKQSSLSIVQKLMHGCFAASGIFLFHPAIQGYAKAKFPGVVVFSEIYQGEFEDLSPIFLPFKRQLL